MKSSICEYFKHCNVAKITGRNCADYKNCETWKYEQQYKESTLGIGAMTVSPQEILGLEKEVQDGS